MYRNVDTDLLWLRLLAKYLIHEYNLKRSKADSCIFDKKDNKGKLELMIPVHVNNVIISGNPETLKNSQGKIKLKLNIQESEKAKKFLGAYYELGRDEKWMYAKMTMDKDVKKLVNGYGKFIAVGVEVQKYLVLQVQPYVREKSNNLQTYTSTWCSWGR